MATGLAVSSAVPTTALPQATPMQGGNVISIGAVQAAPLSVVLEEERRQAEATQASPVIQSLAGHVRSAWQLARDSKQRTVLDRLLKNLRARRGEYDPDKLAAIKEMGGADVYCMLTSVKCRAAASWIRDVMIASGTEKPWTIRPTPVPELTPQLNEAIVKMAEAPIMQAMQAGITPSDKDIQQLLMQMRERALNEVREQARQMAERMESKMEDQLVEGGFVDALSEFIDDIVTFPSAILKGPVVRNKRQLKWVQGPDGWKPQVKNEYRLEWERVSPFNIYPSPQSSDVDDGFLIEKHRLSRRDLVELIDVKGYDTGAIRMALDHYGRGGLREWLWEDVAQASAEGKQPVFAMQNRDELIDALQFWGSIQGKLLREYGMTEEEVPDETREYDCEIWLIGNYVIKATLNGDPFGHKPYYKASYEEIPGAFWGNSPADLVRDAQVVVNAAARALVNNMGIASGPQVVVNVDRLPPGETITKLVPWKIWQVTNDPQSGAASVPPIDFMQPSSNVEQLSGIITRFMELADEWSGIPKYMTGDAPGGAGRTASGLSMLMSNAGKSLKQVIANIDNSVLKPLLMRLYNWNMQYGEDPDLKGDVNIVVRGANALIAKEAAQVRRNEFLAATANPVDMAIVGAEGRATVLREVAKGLDMDTDKIVPPLDVLRQKFAVTNGAAPGAPGPQQQQIGPPQNNKQELMDGAPVTDNFSPPKTS